MELIDEAIYRFTDSEQHLANLPPEHPVSGTAFLLSELDDEVANAQHRVDKLRGMDSYERPLNFIGMLATSELKLEKIIKLRGEFGWQMPSGIVQYYLSGFLGDTLIDHPEQG